MSSSSPTPAHATPLGRLGRVVARNSAFGIGAQIAIKVLSFAFSILIVRDLGAEAYGQYAAVLAFGAVFVFFADLGLSPWTVRQVATERDRPDGSERVNALFGNVLPLRLVLSILTAGLIVLAAVATGRPQAVVGAIALGTLGLIMYGVQGACAAILAGFERLDVTAVAQVLQQLAFVAVGAIALLLGFGYYGLVVANLVGVAFLTGTCWRAVRGFGVRPTGTAVPLWPSLLRASFPFGIIGFTLGLSYNFDSVLLSIYRGDAETGYYNAAYNLVFSAVVLSNVLNTALYPSLARQMAAAPDGLAPVFERAFGYLLALSLPIAVGAWALADRLIPFLFSAAYLASIPVLQLVIWVVPLMFVSEFLGYVVVIRGEERRVARAVLLSTGLNVALNLILVPRFGMLGAAAMTVLTELVLVGQYLWLLRSVTRTFGWERLLLRPLVASFGMGAALLALPPLPLVVAVGVGGVAYLGLVLATGVLGKDEVRLLLNLGRTILVPAGQERIE